MRIKLFFLFFFFCAYGFTADAFAQFDPQSPRIDQLSAAEIQQWAKKDIGQWKTAFGGAEVEAWNPLQIEFYGKVRVKGLSASELETWKAKSDADWEAAFGGPMDTWKIHDMIFFTAINDLKM